MTFKSNIFITKNVTLIPDNLSLIYSHFTVVLEKAQAYLLMLFTLYFAALFPEMKKKEL